MKNYKALPLSILCTASSVFAVNVTAEEQAPATPVTVEIVAEQSSTASINEVGKIKATDSAALTFSAGEKLKALNFSDGDVVKEGELIAQLDDDQAKAELDKAESSLALAESKLNRVLALLKKQPDSMSAQDVEELKQEANLARADFRQKKTDMQNYQLIAPFDGQLTNFTHSVGSRVEAATALVSLIKLDPVEVHYSISQSEVGKAKLGQTVSLTVDAYQDQTFTGTVNYIAPLVDESSGRVEIHAHLDNPDNALVPGMFAKVSQTVSEEHAEVVVSQTAIETDGDERFVWVVENEKAIKRPITLGENTNNGYVVIESGLNLGETVVVTGRQNLTSGSRVAVKQTKSQLTLPSRTLPAQPEKQVEEEKTVAENETPVSSETPETEAAEVKTEESQAVVEPTDTKTEEVTDEAS
ncbi:efflux RND transporter periplasmic adaptor subunit [Vibrio sp. Isolate25]|uniref:efflux RND transporter periplasmic adaptor subunit n=1 Tax=Vibrio TaxID=662 RepID=UPI001EFC88FF|nr:MULTISPECIES: efflux RND transporter periplasmic adaptor subunit [Vibrio]MCG9597621.1 efflux RND transporter periplasmic adaptor subunit [Vibrio sp. Isolate25]MCG9678771.1 efflux RND transporter periplasmic adaptor subunit [Vibrio sp. Isolate24]USD31365.1 efflux RND transporter periplasmic adaptor subunit [Vibrio sp. SCSIO 43186]USD44410.1 efflux RND transporter periplasmic adaptor subunit [Vibrio sp. SCSIO 43145]USD68488.1 efflux RND transporter periplasmic adaptor subunit [Vibrio sp. SCSI